MTTNDEQVMHQLCRADYVNVKFELIQLQGQVSRVPELSLASFPRLGTLLRTCPPVDLTDPSADYGWVLVFLCCHSFGRYRCMYTRWSQSYLLEIFCLVRVTTSKWPVNCLLSVCQFVNLSLTKEISSANDPWLVRTYVRPLGLQKIRFD